MKKLDLIPLLTDCPKGIELYTTVIGNVKFDSAPSLLNQIKVTDIVGKEHLFTCDGYYLYNKYNFNSDGECTIFPSKEVRDWGCFRVAYIKGIKGKHDEIEAVLQKAGGHDSKYYLYSYESYLYYIDRLDNKVKCAGQDREPYIYNYIISTGTELKLKEDESEFKEGDVVFANIPMMVVSEPVKGIPDDYQILLSWANSPDCNYRHASEEEIAKWNEDILHPRRLHYSTSKRKFTNWFLPFDKVIVNNDFDGTIKELWCCDIFSHYINGLFCCIGGEYRLCLPYNEETDKLVGTNTEYNKD